jgi:hypothetical protein
MTFHEEMQGLMDDMAIAVEFSGTNIHCAKGVGVLVCQHALAK